MQEAATVVGASEVTHDDQVAKVSVVGLGMARQTGVANKMFSALAAEGINIQMITTSEIKISVLVDRDSALRRPARRAPGLRTRERNRRMIAAERRDTSRTPPTADNGPDLGNLVERLHGIDMEELFISDLVARPEPGAGHDRRGAQSTGCRRARVPEHRRRGDLRGHDRPKPQRLHGPDQPEFHGARRPACRAPWRSRNNWPPSSAATR